MSSTDFGTNSCCNNNNNTYGYASNNSNMQKPVPAPSALASAQLIKVSCSSGLEVDPLPSCPTSQSDASSAALLALDSSEGSECEPFLASNTPSRRATRSTSLLRSRMRYSWWGRAHGFLTRNWYLGCLVPACILAALIFVGWATRDYARQLLFWIEMQNPWLTFAVYMALFALVSFPVVVGYFVLLVTAGYLFGCLRGWFTVILGANLGIAVAHATIRSCRHRIPVQRFSRDSPGGQFPTMAEYLHNDPMPSAVMVPEEIDLHRSMALEDLNAYMQAKDAFKEPQRKNRMFAHVLVVAGVDSLRRCPLRQKCEFLYLCDCLRPGAALVLHRSRKRKAGALLFLSEEVDSQLSTIYSHMHHVDDVLPLTMLKKSLLWLLRDQTPELWHFFEPSNPVSRIVKEVAVEANKTLGNPRYILQYTRTFKTPREQSALRRANAIAAESMAELIAQHHRNPKELATSFDYKCRMRHAHPNVSAVTCGLDANGLWQMDAGCQYGGYQGALARCWPSSGRFTPPQKMLYGALLDIRRDLCSLIQSTGNEGTVRTPLELHAAYLILLARHLRELRILPQGNRSAAETVEVARKYNCTPIVVSHVGLDSRDTSRRLLDYPFAPGNVVSLRLSISIPDDCCQAYPEFRGTALVVLFTRLTPIPFGVQNVIFGISSINTKDYHVATMIGLLPAQIINVYLGSTLRSMHEVLNDNNTKLTGYISFIFEVICGVVLMFWVVQKARKELSETLLVADNEEKHHDIQV
ncbi:hypothetical protein M5D96_014052 [Drosophila gunungcola]|uniref:Transmembrane protein 64 n=1 Tax=Drosophila gunungcola TaxID=103775 RepID=A0A9P9YAX8_9MUSC|nr:hypothetical protein M5D96_014052 [Drosophila gunungcola]